LFRALEFLYYIFLYHRLLLVQFDKLHYVHCIMGNYKFSDVMSQSSSIF